TRQPSSSAGARRAGDPRRDLSWRIRPAAPARHPAQARDKHDDIPSSWPAVPPGTAPAGTRRTTGPTGPAPRMLTAGWRPQDQADRLDHQISSAARPGRVLPWMNSRLAPPPVETWPNASSAKPRARRAAPVSPPPTTVNASPSAIARATAIVPAAY